MPITFLTNEDGAVYDKRLKALEDSQGSGENPSQGGLSAAMVNALHGMFKVCLFNDSKDVDGAIAAFEEAFGITDSGGGDSGGEDSGGDDSGGITGDALPTDGLLGYWDFRSAPERTDYDWHWSYNPEQGEGGAYANIRGGTKGTEQPPAFGSSMGVANAFCLETKPETYPGDTAASGFGTQFTLMVLTHGGPNNWESGGSNMADELCKFYPKYKTESETKQTTLTAIPSSDKTGYHLSAYRVDGAALAMYVNAKQVAAFDGNEYDGFVQWADRLSVGVIWNTGTVVAVAVYNRPLTETEIVEAYAFMKTLEVTA